MKGILTMKLAIIYPPTGQPIELPIIHQGSSGVIVELKTSDNKPSAATEWFPYQSKLGWRASVKDYVNATN